MLRVNLAAADERPVQVQGSVSPDDPALGGTDLDLRAPVQAAGRITNAGVGRYYWRGRIEALVGGHCRRCLSDVEKRIDLKVDALFTDQQEADDPSVYVIPEGAQTLDLADAIREELVLSVSDYTLCREDCKGLCPQCGVDWNQSPCQCAPDPDDRWAALKALRGTLPGNEEP